MLLAAQAALVLWVVGQADRSVLARPPLGLARLIASDLGAALEAEPAADAERLLRDSFGRVPQNVFVVFTDGTSSRTGDSTCPSAILAARAPRADASATTTGRARACGCAARRFPPLRVGGELKGVVVVTAAGRPY